MGRLSIIKQKKSTCAALVKDQLYLNDSGGQYLDGTTDVTRTMHFGTPTQYEQDCFTRVLKGHIALARAIFPENVEGVKLDTLARLPLWEAGLDYGHGTGHGVGAFLNVHEKGVSVSARLNPGGLGIGKNMVISNEPGYYEEGKFGIRVESVMIVNECSMPNSVGKQKFCEFETITMTPIQRKLINLDLLNRDEIKWIDQYHQKVQSRLLPLLRQDAGDEGVSSITLAPQSPNALEYLLRDTKPL